MTGISTIMAGLNCGTPSGIGWPMVRDAASAFLSCEDDVTTLGMRLYYYPKEGTYVIQNKIFEQKSIIYSFR